MAEAEIAPGGDAIWMKTTMVENYLAERVPGIGWREKDDCWRVPLSWASCLVLRHLFGWQLTVGPKLQQWGWHEREKVMQRLRYHRAIETNEFEWAYAHQFVPDHLTMYPFQTAGAIWLDGARGSLLADDMGSGKTIQAAVASRLSAAEHRDGIAVVICTAPSRHMWRRELEKWAPDWFPVVVDGSAASRRKQILDASPGQVLIISWASLASHTRLAPYASIRAKRCVECGGPRDPATGETMVKVAQCETHMRELNNIPVVLTIADEAHRAKDPHTRQTRAWWYLSWNSARTIAMTGTPLEDNISDLWSILHGLDPIAFPGKSKFLDLFATTSLNFFGGTEILGLKPENQQLFYSILDLYMRRMPKELVLPQLPSKMPPVYRYVGMAAEQRKAYDAMTKDMMVQLDSLLTAKNPLAKLSHQIGLASAAGSVRNVMCNICKGRGKIIISFSGDEGVCETCEGSGIRQELHMIEPSCKVDDLVEFIKDFGKKPLVVFAVRRELLELAGARLAKEGISHVFYTGAQNQQQKNSAEFMFQAGKVQVILVSYGAGAEALTLTASDTIYFMQRHPSFLKNKQAEDRVHRIGSEGHDAINYIIALTADTVESRIAELYEEKGERFEEVVRDKAMLRWVIEGGSRP